MTRSWLTTRRDWTVTTLVVAVTSGLFLASLRYWVPSRPAAVLATLLATVVAGGLAWRQVRAARVAGEVVDPWHPSLIPTGFVWFSFLAPAVVVFVFGKTVGGAMTYGLDMSPEAPALLALGVVVCAMGAAYPASRPAGRPTSGSGPARGSIMLLAGRALMVGAVLLGILVIVNGGMVTRGRAQTTWEIGDVPHALLSFIPLTAAILLLAGTWLRGEPRLLSMADAFLVAVALAVLLLTGDRSPLVELVLPVLMFWTWRSGKAALGKLAVFAVGIATLMWALVRVRTAVRGGSDTRTPWEAILGDLAPALFTTAVVADQVPSERPFMLGGTLVTTLTRLLPSSMTVPLFGEPEGTGGVVFREMTALDNPNYGTAFSIPAEGYLNFGWAGVALLLLAVGLLLSVAYVRFSVDRVVSGLLYPVVVASLPFAMRNDVHGAVKSILYPLVVLGLVHVVIRVMKGRSVSDSSG